MTYDVVQIAGTNIPRSTLKGIQVASAQSGVSFQYLLAKASQESGFKADAEASTSSAFNLHAELGSTFLNAMVQNLVLATSPTALVPVPAGA